MSECSSLWAQWLYHYCPSHSAKTPETVKVKGKIVPVLLTEHHAMKAYWKNGGIAPLSL